MGIGISFVISDENMNFLNGRESANILNGIYEKNKIKVIPFFLLTSDEIPSTCFKVLGKIMNKPLDFEKAEELFLNPLR